jgi:hypothetical protein
VVFASRRVSEPHGHPFTHERKVENVHRYSTPLRRSTLRAREESMCGVCE